MAISEYEYSIYDDFIINHKVNITILQEEIEKNTNIIKEIHHIDANLDNDLCVIYFYDELTIDEEDVLDAIVAAHTGEYQGGGVPGDIGSEGGPGDLVFTFADDPGDYYIKFKNSSWTIGIQFIFRGTNKIGIPTGIKAVLKGEGKLRLYDKTNNRTIFQWDNYDVNDWTIFSQSSDLIWPENEAILELQGEKDSSYAYISCFMICFSGIVEDNTP